MQVDVGTQGLCAWASLVVVVSGTEMLSRLLAADVAANAQAFSGGSCTLM